MAEVITSLFGNMIGVAISPLPIIAMILMLFSPKAKVNGLAFTVGWMVGTLIWILVVSQVGMSASSDDASSGAWISIVFGVLFLFLAFKQWQGRPKEGEEPHLPGWMEGIDSMPPTKAFLTGVVLQITNPKNLGLIASSGAVVAAANLTNSELWTTIVIFVIGASISFIIPLLLIFVAYDRVAPGLSRLKDWLVTNNATIMFILFLFLGANSLGSGISALTASSA